MPPIPRKSPSYARFCEILCGALLAATMRGNEEELVHIEDIMRAYPPLAQDFIKQEDLFHSIRYLAQQGFVYPLDMANERLHDLMTWLPDNWKQRMELEDYDDMISISGFEITDIGKIEIENPGTKIGKFAKRFYNSTDEYVSNIIEDAYEPFERHEPIRYPLDDVEIDARGSTELADLSAKVDTLVRLLAASNQVAASNSVELKHAVTSIETGAQMVQTGVFSPRSLEGAFWASTLYVGEKFVGTPIGDAATLVWNAVKALVASLVGF